MYDGIYCIGELGLFRRGAWWHRLNGASCLISLAHGCAGIWRFLDARIWRFICFLLLSGGHKRA
jgi:hypothetical protein